MAAAAVLSNPFFLAAAAASSRGDIVNHPSMDQSSIRMPTFDEHRLQLSSPINNKFSTKRPLSPSPSFLSKQTLDEMNNISPIKKPTPTVNYSRSNSFTPLPTTNSSVSKLKIIANENSPDKSVTLSIELNGINYQGTLYANGFKD